MTIRVVVADQSEARFYDLGMPREPLVAAGTIQDANAHLHDRDFNSDRPGRVAPRTGGGTIRSAIDGDRSPRDHEADLFARHVTRQLERAHRRGSFDKLVLMAPPAFLGMLRAALPKSLRGIVAEEIDKALVHEPVDVLRRYLTEKSLGMVALRGR
jgi:protein required for attachment to host cells